MCVSIYLYICIPTGIMGIRILMPDQDPDAWVRHFEPTKLQANASDERKFQPARTVCERMRETTAFIGCKASFASLSHMCGPEPFEPNMRAIHFFQLKCRGLPTIATSDRRPPQRTPTASSQRSHAVCQPSRGSVFGVFREPLAVCRMLGQVYQFTCC